MKALLSLLLSITIASVTLAQTRPPGMADMKLITNAEEFLDIAMPWLEDESAIKNATTKIKSKKDPITSILNWTYNGGYLVRVKVYKSPLTNNSVPQSPEFLGFGDKPADIVAVSSDLAAITAAPPSGLVFDEDRSFYIWITQKRGFLGFGGKKLAYGLIPGALAKQTTADAINKLASAEVMADLQLAKKADVMDDILQNLKHNVSDKQMALRVAQQIEALEKNQAKLNELRQRLQNDLKKIDQENQLLSSLKVMGTVLSMANLTLQVRSALDDIPVTELKKAKNPQDLINVVSTYQKQKGESIETYRREITIISTEADKQKPELDKNLQDIKVPSSVIRSGLY